MSTPFYIDPVDGSTYPLDQPRWCSQAQRPMLITPLPGISRDDIDRADKSQWRYRASLPLEIANPISLGEGLTPLVQKSVGTGRPFFKLDFLNPTGSFKDRGSTVMLSYLRQCGIKAVLEDSSGNGGSSIAGYGAAGGLGVKIIAPAYTSPGKIAQVRAYGAEVELVEGPREASQAEAVRQSEQIFYASHNWQPFFLQGTKMQAYEIWEDFGYRVPDNIIISVGAGSSVLGLYFGFQELLAAGQIDRLPRLFIAQPTNCSPIDASFHAGVDHPVDRPTADTIAEGTAIKFPMRLKEILTALRHSNGGSIAIDEDEIVSALRSTCESGLFIEPTSATAPAAYIKLLAQGKISATDETVIMLSGSGLKAASRVAELLGA